MSKKPLRIYVSCRDDIQVDVIPAFNIEMDGIHYDHRKGEVVFLEAKTCEETPGYHSVRVVASGAAAVKSIQAPFGATALRILQHLCSLKTFEERFVQTVADQREEINVALNNGRADLVFSIQIRGYLQLTLVLLQVVVSPLARAADLVRKLYG